MLKMSREQRCRFGMTRLDLTRLLYTLFPWYLFWGGALGSCFLLFDPTLSFLGFFFFGFPSSFSPSSSSSSKGTSNSGSFNKPKKTCKSIKHTRDKTVIAVLTGKINFLIETFQHNRPSNTAASLKLPCLILLHTLLVSP